MKKLSIILPVALGVSMAATNVLAADQGLETCIQTVKKEKQGQFVKLEKLNIAGKGAFGLELHDSNRNHWKFTCDAESGKILEKETAVSDPNTSAFKKNVKVTEEDALAIALKANPGVLQTVEYEIEESGASSYAFDIVNDKGVRTKVEVDAATGKIDETITEEWEIGE